MVSLPHCTSCTFETLSIQPLSLSSSPPPPFTPPPAGTSFNLTDGPTLLQLLASALGALSPAAAAAVANDTATTSLVQTATDALVLINSYIQQMATGASAGSPTDTPEQGELVLAHLSRVCQASAAPAAKLLVGGELSADVWAQQYSQGAISQLALGNSTMAAAGGRRR